MIKIPLRRDLSDADFEEGQLLRREKRVHITYQLTHKETR